MAPRVVTEQLRRSFDQMAPARLPVTRTSTPRPSQAPTWPARSLTPPESSPMSRCPALRCSIRPGAWSVAPRFERPAQHPIVSEAIGEETRDRSVLDGEERAARREPARRPGSDLHRLLGLGGEDDQLEVEARRVGRQGRDVAGGHGDRTAHAGDLEAGRPQPFGGGLVPHRVADRRAGGGEAGPGEPAERPAPMINVLMTGFI
jgi:hypothetical protein